MATIEFRVADITELAVDGIVCPAHKHLIKGRGLSAQVFDRAGEALAEECAHQDECAIGDACITKGYLLPAKYVIHAVTPMWSSGDQYGAKVLKTLSSCYENSLQLAKERHLKCIALSALGAGNNRTPSGYPPRWVLPPANNFPLILSVLLFAPGASLQGTHGWRFTTVHITRTNQCLLFAQPMTSCGG